jgi:hypothetical protein
MTHEEKGDRAGAPLMKCGLTHVAQRGLEQRRRHGDRHSDQRRKQGHGAGPCGERGKPELRQHNRIDGPRGADGWRAGDSLSDQQDRPGQTGDGE